MKKKTFREIEGSLELNQATKKEMAESRAAAARGEVISLEQVKKN